MDQVELRFGERPARSGRRLAGRAPRLVVRGGRGLAAHTGSGSGLPVLLREVGLEHVFRDRRGGGAAIAAVLGEDDAGDLAGRRAARRTRTRRCRADRGRLARRAFAFVGNDLGRAGLARTSLPIDPRAAAGAGAVDGEPQPSCTGLQIVLAGSGRSCAAAAGRSGCQPCPRSTALTTCGVTTVPPLATVAIIVASAIGVTDTAPWPMPTEIVSPGYHFSLSVFSFHSVDGTRLSTSPGKSIPVLPTRPSSSGIFVNRVDTSCELATL